MRSISISQTVKFLHMTFTFYLFGNLALNSQNQINGQILKILFFWAYIISIYLNAFELDLHVLEQSDG